MTDNVYAISYTNQIGKRVKTAYVFQNKKDARFHIANYMKSAKNHRIIKFKVKK